jgi:hypothetical protein
MPDNLPDDLLEEDGRVRYEEEVQMSEARWGRVAVVSGEVLLLMDVILLSFFYSSIRDGSLFWVWWVLSQGALGLATLAGGEWYEHHHLR